MGRQAFHQRWNRSALHTAIRIDYNICLIIIRLQIPRLGFHGDLINVNVIFRYILAKELSEFVSVLDFGLDWKTESRSAT